MIVVDTHVWIWRVHQDDRLIPQFKDFITQHETRRIGVCAISYWEVARRSQKKVITGISGMLTAGRIPSRRGAHEDLPDRDRTAPARSVRRDP